MRLHIYSSLWLLFLGCILGTSLWASAYPGALKVRSQAWGQQFRHNPLPITPEGFWAGQLQLHIQRCHASLWGFERKYILDAQTVDEIAQVSLGLSQAWKLHAGLSRRQLQASGMDQITTGFHKLFLIPQDKRLDVDMNRNLVTIPTYGLEYNEESEGAPYSQSYEVGLSGQIKLPEWHAVLLGSLALSEETSAFSPRAERVRDSSLQVYWQANLRSLPMQYYIGWHYLHYGQNSSFDRNLKKTQSVALGGLGWSFANTTEIKTQLMISEPIFSDLGQLSRETYEVQLGLQHQWQQLQMQLVLIENIIWPYNTPDWGWSFAIDYGFKGLF